MNDGLSEREVSKLNSPLRCLLQLLLRHGTVTFSRTQTSERNETRIQAGPPETELFAIMQLPKDDPYGLDGEAGELIPSLEALTHESERLVREGAAK